MKYFENEGALFRGGTRSYPQEVWFANQKRWAKYEGSVPKPVDWGSEISEEEALAQLKQDEARVSDEDAKAAKEVWEADRASRALQRASG